MWCVLQFRLSMNFLSLTNYVCYTLLRYLDTGLYFVSLCLFSPPNSISPHCAHWLAISEISSLVNEMLKIINGIKHSLFDWLGWATKLQWFRRFFQFVSFSGSFDCDHLLADHHLAVDGCGCCALHVCWLTSVVHRLLLTKTMHYLRSQMEYHEW